jgi:hypothetical protein
MSRKAFRNTLAGLTLVGVAVLGAPSAAMAVSGNQTFRTLTVGTTPANVDRTVIAAGPISGVGTERILSMKELPNGATRVRAAWDFPNGTVYVTMIVHTHFQGEPTPPSCRVVATINGTWRITGGTGAYRNASGHGTFTGLGQILVQYNPRTNSCSENRANLILNQRSYQGTATVPGSLVA